MRVMLGPDDFQRLVGGETLRKGPIEIALSDIGWDVMQGMIAQAKMGARRGRRAQEQEHPQEAPGSRP